MSDLEAGAAMNTGDADLDDTQEIDPPAQYRTGGEDDFAECAACSAKLGMVKLCPACLHNRNLVSRLRRQIKAHSTPEPFDGDQRIPVGLDYHRRKNRPVILPAPTSLTLEQDLWVRGFLAEQQARQYAANPSEAGEALLSGFRERFPGALP